MSVSAARTAAAPVELARPQLCRGRRLAFDGLSHDGTNRAPAAGAGSGCGPVGGPGAKHCVRSVCLVPEPALGETAGPELVVLTGDGALAVVRAGRWSGKLLTQGHTSGVRAVATHPYKPLCASVCRRAVLLWDTETGAAAGRAPVRCHRARRVRDAAARGGAKQQRR